MLSVQFGAVHNGEGDFLFYGSFVESINCSSEYRLKAAAKQNDHIFVNVSRYGENQKNRSAAHRAAFVGKTIF